MSPGNTSTTYLVTGTSWYVPLDWDSTSNTIECIGGGGAGGRNGYNAGYNAGGGGGAYAKISNLSLTPGTYVTYSVGASGDNGPYPYYDNGTDGGDTWFNGTSISDASVVAKGGQYPTHTIYGGTGGAGGAAADCVGDVKYSGGAGGNAYYNGGIISGQGGGAAGPNGAGEDAVNGWPLYGGRGGNAGNGYGGLGGYYNGNYIAPTNGSEWFTNKGSGGGGINNPSCQNGAYYGGGGSSYASSGTGPGAGGPGLIVIKYRTS